MEEGEEGTSAVLASMSTETALGFLTEAAKDDNVSEEKVERFKSVFSQMFDELKRAEENQPELETQLGQLEKQLAEEKLKIKSGRGIGEEEESTTLSSLREDLQQAKAEVALGLEREQVLLLEMNELQRQRDRLKLSVEALDIEKAKEIEPQVKELRLQISEIEEERDQEVLKGETARESLQELNTKIESIEASLKKIDEEKVSQEVALSRIETLPEKIKKQTELLNKTLEKLRAQESALDDKLNGIEKNADSNNQKLKFLNDDHFKINSTLEKSQLVQQQKERIVDLLRKELDTLEIESEQLMADKVKLDIELKGCKEESQNAMDNLNRRQKEKDKTLRKFKKVEAQCKHVKANIPGLENQLEQIKHSIVLYESQIKKQQVSIGSIKKEIEASMDYYMQEESKGKEKTLLFQQSYAEVVESEKELVILKKEELQRERNIMELKNLKERVQHQVVSKMNKFKEAVEVAQLKDMIRADLKKKKKDTFRRLHEFQQLYELVKSQRNKFVNLIQASSQSIAEMKEKLKILSNELEILRTETMNKEKLLAKARLDRSTAQADREHVRTELNKCAFVFKQKQEVIEEQISEIDKLNSIISLTERDMLRLKRLYEVSVEGRNQTGILLIDRNDELCILYEKSNIQEEVIRQGEVVLTQKGNEIRSLNIEVKELRRSIDVNRKLTPEISLYDRQIVLHKQQLLQAKQQAVKLEKDLEDPENAKRWRKLEGKIPDKEELNAKLKQLEDRLNDKREQLLEKTLILEEISSLSQRLKQEIRDLREEISILKGSGSGEDEQELNPGSQMFNHIKQQITQYVGDASASAKLNVGGSMSYIRTAFQIFKGFVTNPVHSGVEPKAKPSDIKGLEEQCKKYKLQIQQRDNEISILVSMMKKRNDVEGLQAIPQPSLLSTSHDSLKPAPIVSAAASSPRLKSPGGGKENMQEAASTNQSDLDVLSNTNLLADRNKAFEIFRKSYRKSEAIEENKLLLKDKFKQAKTLGRTVSECKKNISGFKSAIEKRRMERAVQGLSEGNDGEQLEDPQEDYLKSQIEREKGKYKEGFARLKELKREIEHIQRILENSRKKLQSDFEHWLSVMVRQQQGHIRSPMGKKQERPGVRQAWGDTNHASPTKASYGATGGKKQLGSTSVAKSLDFDFEVDPAVLQKAKPLLTGNAEADRDIIKFYQARHKLVNS